MPLIVQLNKPTDRQCLLWVAHSLYHQPVHERNLKIYWIWTVGQTARYVVIPVPTCYAAVPLTSDLWSYGTPVLVSLWVFIFKLGARQIWVKIGYNSGCMRDISKILASGGVFRGWAIKRCQANSSTTDPGCHGNEIWAKIGYNSACMRDISEILASSRSFRSRAIEEC